MTETRNIIIRSQRYYDFEKNLNARKTPTDQRQTAIEKREMDESRPWGLWF